MEKQPVSAWLIPASDSTIYPAPSCEQVAGRIKHKLGDYYNLTGLGINLTVLSSGAATALMHYHTKSDEMIYILEGTPVLRLGNKEHLLNPGDCYGFKAGNSDAAQVVNRTAANVVLLEMGNRVSGDEVFYPEDNLRAVQQADGHWEFTSKKE